MSNSLLKTALLRSTILVGVATIASPAFAQVADAEAAPQTAAADANSAADNEEIVVTGTLIRNPNLESSSPVSVIGENELILRNVNNVEEILRDLPGSVPGIGSQVNNGNGGYSTVDLRGLGFQRNLVLLDGDRLVPADQTGAVDLNNVPVALIERTDVLTGGASTTYGADAVTGVVNFITRKDFEGVDLSASYQITDKGDGAYYRTDLTVGGNFADDRGNAVLSVGYQEADPVYQGDRDISIFGIGSASTGSQAGRASGSSFTSVPATFSFASGDFQINPTGTALVPQYQGFNFNPFNIFQTPFKRHNVYGAASYDITDSIEVYGRALFSKNTVSTIIAPSGIFGEALTVPANNPFLPTAIRDQLCTANGIALGATCNTQTALPLGAVYRRTTELGPRISEYVTTVLDYRVGTRFAISDSWSADFSVGHGESEITQTQSGYVLRSRVQQALNATNNTTCLVATNNCVPLNLFGGEGSITPAQAAFIGGLSVIRLETQLDQLRAVFSGDLGATTPWAEDPISLAIGGEYRDYGYDRVPDILAAVPGELGGAGGAVLPFSGGYDVKEIYGELLAPLVQDAPFFNELTLELGARYSDYKVDAPGSPSFNTTTYKVGSQWEVSDGFTLRGNYQRAVRAPNIQELFTPVSTGLTNLAIDPCAGAAPTTNANLALACRNQGAPAASIGLIQNPSADQANATGGGNPNLQPEKADTYTFGVVLQPKGVVSGLTVAVDYYNIKIDDAIAFQTPGDAIAACFGSNPAAITAAQANSPACLAIRRSTTNGRLSGSSATVPGLPRPRTNLGRLETDGIDLKVDFTTDLGFVGLSNNFVGNWTNNSRFQASPSSVDRNCVGYYSANCGVSLGQIQPEFSFSNRTTFSFDFVDLSVLWRYISSVEYEGQASDFAARGFTTTSRNLFNGTITNAAGANSPLAGTQANFNKIDAYHYFDLSARFGVGEHLDLVFGVQNVFDKEAPVVGSGAGSTTANSGNTFPSTYDVLGRTFSVSGRVRF